MSNQKVDIVDVALTITKLKEENDEKDKLIYDLRKRNHELLERNRYLEQSVECKIEHHDGDHGYPELLKYRDLVGKEEGL